MLITGATGFVGGRLAHTLASRGAPVCALVRPGRDVARLTAAGVEVRRGDLTDPASLARAVHGQDVVINCASVVRDWGGKAHFWPTNVEGTRNLLEACLAAGVKRVVHLSSLTVLGLPRDGRTLDEQSPPATAASLEGDPYSASKLAAEKIVAEASARGLSVVIIRPGAIWGPGDRAIVPRLAPLLRARLVPYLDGGTNLVSLVHVDNLVDGILLAASAPLPAPADGPRVYHLTDGEDMPARQVLDGLAAALGTRPPAFSVPFGLVYSIASLIETAMRVLKTRRPPPISRYGVRLVGASGRYDISKARRELGYQPTVTFQAGMAELGALHAPA